MTIHTGASAVHLDATDGPAGYAAAVRAHLADLPEETVEDLTDGLEADLAEQATEHGTDDLTVLLGPAGTYAAELRASAGLPAGGGRTGRSWPRSGAEALAAARQSWRRSDDALSRFPWWPAAKRTVVAFRPLWWLLRAWIATRCFHYLVGRPSPSPSLLLFVVLAAVSVALGQGWLRRHPPVRALVALGNAVAVVALLIGLVLAGSDLVTTHRESYGPVQQDGVYVQGQEVSNLFAYDLNGKPLRGFRLYDQAGRPVAVNAEQGQAMSGTPTEGPLFDYSTGARIFPYRSSNSSPQWNTFPQYTSRSDSLSDPTPEQETPVEPTPPHASVSPVTAPVVRGAASAGTTPLRPATPQVSGRPAVGTTLHAAAGRWSPTPRFTYQWSRGGVAIPGATHATYRAVTADRGHTLTVTVTGRLTGHTTTAATSSPTAAVK